MKEQLKLFVSWIVLLAVLLSLSAWADRGGGSGASSPAGGSTLGLSSTPGSIDWSCVGGVRGDFNAHSSGGAALAAQEWHGLQFSTVGTVTHPDEDPAVLNGASYINIVSGAGSTGFADIFSGAGTTGVGAMIRQNGFWVLLTFAPGTNTVNTIGYVGVGVESGIANNNPDSAAGRNHSISMMYRTTDGTGANWQLMIRGASSAAQTVQDLGANCIRATNRIYQFFAYAPPSGVDNRVMVAVRASTDGTTWSTCLAPTWFSGANLPDTTSELVVENYLQDGTVGGTGTAQTMRVISNRTCRNLGGNRGVPAL